MTKFVRTGARAAVLAAVGATALAACGSSTGSSVSLTPNGSFGAVPSAASGAEHGGTVTVAAPPNTAANWILPIITGADNSVYTVDSFDYEMYRPLYWFVNGVEPAPNASMSLASLPVWSNGDKTATITLKSNYKWSNGQPLTSQDVLFWYDEMEAAIAISPANWAYYTPGLGIPDQVASVTAPNSSTVVFNLKTAVNPTWFTEDELGAIQPLPAASWAKDSATGPTLDFTVPANAKKIYTYLAAQSGQLSTYATNPLWQVVDGPYHLTSFNSTTGAYTMVPNTSYGGPESKAPPTVSLVPFTSDDAEVNAVKARSVDVGYVPLTNLKETPTIQKLGYNVFGYPDFGWSYVAYNFADTTGDFNHIIGQLYIRQVMAHLEDEQGYIKGFFFGAGGQAFGPVPSLPASPFTPTNAKTNPYPFSISTAISILKAHGWTVNPGGTDVCSSSSGCGTGIPAGTKLAFPLVYGSNPTIIAQQVEDLASDASKAGVHITLSSSTFNFMVENYNNPAAPKDADKWAMEDFGGFTDSTYPTTFGVFNSTGSSNLGSYSDPTADKLIQASISSSNPSAVTAEASYLTAQQPGLFQPNPDLVVVWLNTLSGTPQSFESLTQYQLNPEFWYFTK